MSDEEKSIEEIIAELEGLEKEAKEGESTQAVQKDDDAPVELTMEEPRDDIQRMETPSATGVAQDGPEEYADIFAEEKTPGEASADIEIEELSEEITLTDSMDDKPAQPPSSDDSLTDEIILEESLEGLSLDEPGKVQATETEGPAAIGLHDSDGPAQKEAGEMELFLESDEISLEEVTPERVEVDATAEMSARSVGDEISLEETTVDEGEDDAAVDEPSFGDAVEPVLDRPPQLAEEDKALFDDQTMRFAPEERDAAPAHGDSSGAPFDKRLLSEVHTTMPAGGEPPAEPPDWTAEGFLPDEPPPPPPKGRKPLKMKRSRVALFLGIFLIVVVLYGIFVWPKLYEYRLVKSGDVKYQVKINRITKTQHYFDAGSWHRGSVPTPLPQAARHKIDVKPAEEKKESPPVVKEPITVATQQEAQPQEAFPPTAEEEKGVPMEAKRAEEQVAPPAQEPVHVAAVETAPGPEKDLKDEGTHAVPVKKAPQEEKALVKTAGEGNYAIQLSAMRLEDFADELTASLKKKGWPVMQDTVMDRNSEPWYRVFLGGFATRGDAESFMKAKNIKKVYPGSYVRSVAPSAEAD